MPFLQLFSEDTGTDFLLRRNPREPKRQFVSPITGPTFLFLPNLPELKQIATVQMPIISQESAQDNLSALHTAIVPTIVEKKATNSIVGEQIGPLQMTAVSQFADVEDNDAIVLQTVSIVPSRKNEPKRRSVLFLPTFSFCSWYSFSRFTGVYHHRTL